MPVTTRVTGLHLCPIHTSILNGKFCHKEILKDYLDTLHGNALLVTHHLVNISFCSQNSSNP